MVVFIAPMSPTMFIQSPHGLACDGCGIAKDDLHELDTVEEQDEVVHELFRSAGRIRAATASNHLLLPIFRKYKKACREILQNKKKEAEQFARLCDYCDECAHDPHQQTHDLKCIQYEMRDIHNQIKSLEEMQWTDDDSESESDLDSDSESDSDSDLECSDHESEDEPSSDSSASLAESESDDSDDSDDSGLSDVTEFLRQSSLDLNE